MARAATAKPKRGFMDCYDRPGHRYDPAVEGFGDPDQWRGDFRWRMGLDEAKAFMGKNDPLSVLGLAVGATWAQIKAAFRKLAMEFHPDRNKAADAEERMKAINAAFSILESQFGQ